MLLRLGFVFTAVFVTFASLITALAQDRVFTVDQAERGQKTFAARCAECHSPDQALDLIIKYGAGQPLAAYHAKLSAIMPPYGERPDGPAMLDVMAFLLSRDGHLMTEARIPASRSIQAKGPATVEWPAWRGDPGGTGYSPADQITAANVSGLKLAWRWSSANMGPTPETRSITTPLMVGGTIYATAGTRRNVVALDAANGEMLWMWRANETPARFENAPRKGAGRGVSYWTDGRGKAQVFTVTPGFSLVALDAASGRPVERFGRKGFVDLMQGLRGAPKDELPDIGTASPPLVIGDVVVVGPAHQVGLRPRSKANVKGDVRGFDARTGRLLWTFHTIPAKGERGYETWEDGSAEYSGNGGVWAPMSADPATGAIFLPVEAGTSDIYGGERKGQNLYTSSLVSLDAKSGKLRWAQQLVHHDIWDWDVPAQPILADIPQASGPPRRAVLQITKQAFVFAFDRDTGEPIWPIEERPVPASDVPGERTWPTQPAPSRPPPFDRQGFSANDMIDFTPALRAEAMEAAKDYRMGRFMSPPSLASAPDGTRGTLALPNVLGGGNWEGGAYDPSTGLLYVGSMTQLQVLSAAPAREGSDIAYISGGGRAPQVQGLPLVKPPYGRITAIDMTTGEHAWMVANADTPRQVATNPALAGLALPRTGVASRAGLLATKTLLFAGEGVNGSPVFRAHDKATGAILAEIALPGTQTGLPMTYVLAGRQYVVMAVAGTGGGAAEIVALALPR